MTAKENKAVRALLKHCKAKNYPKWELDGILIDENKLIATNTKQLVVLDFMDSFQKEQSVGGTMAFESMPTSKNIKVEFPTDLTFTLMANNSFLFENGFKVCIAYLIMDITQKRTTVIIQITEEATAELRELQYWTEIANTIIKLAQVVGNLTIGGKTGKLIREYTENYRDWETDRKSTRLNSSHSAKSRMPSSA